MNDSGLQVMLPRYNSVLKIKKEVKESTDPSSYNFGTDNLCGKALDFQYSVKPKQEILDIKCESESDSLVGEIVEFSEDENNLLCNDRDRETEQEKDPQSQYTFCQICNELFPYKNHVLHANFKTLVTEIISKNNPFVCNICDIAFDNTKEAFDHLDVHNGTPFSCDQCPYTTKKLGELVRHRELRRKKGEVNPNKQYSGREAVSAKLDLTGEVKYFCDLCNFRSSYKRCLKRHRDRHSTRGDLTGVANLNKKNVCDLCNFWSPYNYSFKRHMEVHARRPNFAGVANLNKKNVCDLCNFWSPYNYSFKKHMEVHARRPNFAGKGNLAQPIDDGINTKRPIVVYRVNKKYVCELCNFRTQYRYSLKKHRETHKNGDLADVAKRSFSVHVQDQFEVDNNQVHPNRDPIYCCNRCNYKTTFELDFQMHKIFMHSSDNNIRGLVIVDKIYNCTHCGFTGDNRSTLAAHMKRIHAETKFKCDLCLYETGAVDYLRKHIANKHTKDKEFKKYIFICEICAKRYQTQRALNCHLVKVHNKNLDLPTYYCHSCSYKDIDRMIFTKHVLRHVRREQLFCANCDYKTTIKTNLIQHMVKHADPSKLKMYKCMMCSFETKRPHTLRHHIESHSRKV